MNLRSSSFKELEQIESLANQSHDMARIEIVDQVSCGSTSLPIYKFSFGSAAPNVPVLGLFGGVHGLEKIGTEVINSILQSLIFELSWNRNLQSLLSHFRLVFMPLVNPGGMLLNTRANPRGVDLMRNSPIEAEAKSYYLHSGHRLSAKLPWYRGQHGIIEKELAAMVKVVREEVLNSTFALTLDMHSGFGLQDQIWFPYAASKKPFPHLCEIWALREIYNQTQPFHPYKIEPQSNQYLTHGDAWDYLYGEHLTSKKTNIFLPLTLEMGSWTWVKKNPFQIFRTSGLFHPIKPHRLQRVLRRHWALFDFMLQACSSWDNWTTLSPQIRQDYEHRALRKWYEKK